MEELTKKKFGFPFRWLTPRGKVIARNKLIRGGKHKPCCSCNLNWPITDYGISPISEDGFNTLCMHCEKKMRLASLPAALPSLESCQALVENQRAWSSRRRCRVKGIPGDYSVGEWLALCNRYQGRCLRCGRKGNLSRDHIIPTTDPRCMNDIGNIQPLCRGCNSAKRDFAAIDYRETPFVKQGKVV